MKSDLPLQKICKGFKLFEDHHETHKFRNEETHIQKQKTLIMFNSFCSKENDGEKLY